ncbi:MAG: 4Fe-4S dicluster domain-containing protein [Proteobacteria bacterium]|nr:4Fe-4S dicluster domain-containing protein [Pseudomonadota bacterium]
MSEDVYVKLGERLNRNSVRIPLIPEVLDFLRGIFSREQAELAAGLPLGAHTLQDLARRLGRDSGELHDRLEEMADKGLVFVSRTDTSQSEYSLPPFAPGLIELQFMKGEETPEAKRRADLVLKMNQALASLGDAFFKNTELANEKLRQPGLRTLAVEEELPHNAEIASWERITKILDRETSFAVGTCTCRQEAKFDGHSCEIADVPMEACIYFGKVADFMIDRNFGKRYSRKDLVDLLKRSEQCGLVHNINNFLGDNIVLCNCCGCCCSFLKRMRQYRGLKQVVTSNFVVAADAENCTACETCVDLCQMDALKLKDDAIDANLEYCLGCGNCVAQCPSGSLTLQRQTEYEPPRQRDDIVGLGR